MVSRSRSTARSTSGRAATAENERHGRKLQVCQDARRLQAVQQGGVQIYDFGKQPGAQAIGAETGHLHGG